MRTASATHVTATVTNAATGAAQRRGEGGVMPDDISSRAVTGLIHPRFMSIGLQEAVSCLAPSPPALRGERDGAALTAQPPRVPPPSPQPSPPATPGERGQDRNPRG